MTDGIDRRVFLAWTTTLGLPFALAPFRWWRVLVDNGTDGPGPFTPVLRDREAARRVGEAYLAARPTERDARLLVSAIAAVAPNGPRDLRDAVSRDFTAGRSLLLDGWLLADTEGRLAALVALDERRDDGAVAPGGQPRRW